MRTRLCGSCGRLAVICRSTARCAPRLLTSSASASIPRRLRKSRCSRCVVFPIDASIVFADILLIPGALGQKVWFEAGEGPKLGDMPSVESMAEKAGEAGKALSLVGETLTRVRSALDPSKALIGFAGAPWTVATYMIEKGSSDRSGARTFAYQNPEKTGRSDPGAGRCDDRLSGHAGRRRAPRR